jgi:hypothetical protein
MHPTFDVPRRPGVVLRPHILQWNGEAPKEGQGRWMRLELVFLENMKKVEKAPPKTCYKPTEHRDVTIKNRILKSSHRDLTNE